VAVRAVRTGATVVVAGGALDPLPPPLLHAPAASNDPSSTTHLRPLPCTCGVSRSGVTFPGQDPEK
jgi:hypothetical protein